MANVVHCANVAKVANVVNAANVGNIAICEKNVFMLLMRLIMLMS